jgi:hypothetical protein
MASAKDIHVAPISSAASNRVVRAIHYSGSVVQNSQLHLGAFLDGKLEGAMQFGPSMDKGKIRGLVADTPWNGFIELNRMAFSEKLPRNSESRALGVAFRLFRKHYPHIQWIVSFSDGTQSGDGTIYRAAGFDLIGIKPNKTIMRLPDGSKTTALLLTANWDGPSIAAACKRLGIEHKYRPISAWKAMGAEELPGWQLRYIKFMDPGARARLTVPVLPYSRIAELGAGMYRGEPR